MVQPQPFPKKHLKISNLKQRNLLIIKYGKKAKGTNPDQAFRDVIVFRTLVCETALGSVSGIKWDARPANTHAMTLI